MDNIHYLGSVEFNTETEALLDAASQDLEDALKTAISNSYLETTNSTGELLRNTTVGYDVDADKNMVDRMFIYGSRHSFILHNGVATVAKSKSKKRKRKNYQLHIKETSHFAIAMDSIDFIETLATDLADLRANQVAAAFNYLD